MPHLLSRTSLLTLILCAALPALAQNATKAAHTKKAAIKKVATAKPAAAKKKTPPPEPVLPEASEAQLEAAKRAYLGEYHCEFKQIVNISNHPKAAGYIDVAWQKNVYTMRPVLSSTGALRLEDVAGRTLMIQIANKSMLLDTKLGQRLIDECIHPEQARLIAEARANAASNPEAAAANSIGITPGK